MWRNVPVNTGQQNITMKEKKKECILVGILVPSAAVAVSRWGVCPGGGFSAQRGSLPEGGVCVCVSAKGGVCPGVGVSARGWGCLPRGVYTSPCEQNHRQV